MKLLMAGANSRLLKGDVANGWTDPLIGAQAGTLAEDEDAGEDTLFSVAAKNRPISDNLAKLVKDALREAALKGFEHAGPDLLSLSHRGILSHSQSSRHIRA